MSLLELSVLHAYYGEAHVLQGVSLTLEAGAIVGVLGRNGVGKTTMVNATCGFLAARRGCIRFNGVDITGWSSQERVREGLALVPQGRRVFGSLSVEENLLVARRNVARHGWDVLQVYDLFPRLRERRDQRARTLSGGEQQMLAIGRALMTNPHCLIMDEPTEGLAPIIAQLVWEVIRRVRDTGLAVLLIEQNAMMALRLVDHVHVMSKGQLVHSSAPQSLLDDAWLRRQYLGV